ncbi:MAG: DeoR family glycerol-3-phosphate regulon repressor [Paracoccaceae bacterium]|jgi:DeoR family glycerol-3-phosphate regulon repressor
MAISIRQMQILDLAREAGHVTVDDLSTRFSVSAQTIRRDLTDLCDRHELARTHGGAMLPSGAINLAYDARRDHARDEKERIARACAAAIPDGCSLFMNIGTTTEAVARALLHHQDLMVITNNLNVAMTLSANEGCEVVLAGGVLRRADYALVGEATTDFIRQFKVDMAIIGASAIDPDGSLLDYDYREVRVAQAIIQNARRVCLAADASKFTRTAPVRIASLRELDMFVTDAPPPAAAAALCAETNVDLVIAPR